MKNKCPICDLEMSKKEFCLDLGLGSRIGPIEEQYTNCPSGHYSYEFAYGDNRLSISVPGNRPDSSPDFTITWSYNEKEDRAELREKAEK